LKNKLELLCLFFISFIGMVSAQTSSAIRSDHPLFQKATDILIAQFDNKPDPDDIQSQAALGSLLSHHDFQGVNVYAAQGSYGRQNGVYLDSTALFDLIFGPEGTDTWTDAHKNRSTSVSRIVQKVKPILLAGGHVWVQEAGQSDLTSQWVSELMTQGISDAVTQSQITVVQHSNWNEDQTTPFDLAFVKKNTTYVKIPDGNIQDNGTPGFKLGDTTYLEEVRKSLGKNESVVKWLLADQIIKEKLIIASYKNKTLVDGGVDFSDCVENWWIFNLGTQADTVRKFWDLYVVTDITP
jgi:hypothetical protein